jgi:hypothetical protein
MRCVTYFKPAGTSHHEVRARKGDDDIASLHFDRLDFRNSTFLTNTCSEKKM